jgi:predicted DNA-binding helix-hairpin-helix protein
VRVVDRIVAARKLGALRFDDIARVCRRIGLVRPFIGTPDWRPRAGDTPEAAARRAAPQQLELFA